ncbi:MAG: hypothetical protein U0270_44540 [Labilithrix sp.]
MEELRSDALVLRSRRYIGGGAATIVVSAIAVATGSPIGIGIAVLGGLLGALFIHSGVELRRTGVAIHVYRRLMAALGQGRLEEAGAIVEDVSRSPASKEVLVARVLATVRAMIASARGDFAAAVAAANDAVLLPRRAGRIWDDALHLEARAHRAFGGAVLGASIAEDVDVVTRSPHAVPSQFARVELACAVALARAERKAELAEHLARHAGLLLEHSTPRERALFRALRGYTRTAHGVYRETPRASSEVKLRRWIETVVPAAASFAPGEPATDGPERAPERPPVDPARSVAVIEGRLRDLPPRPRPRWSSYALGIGGAFVWLYVGGMNAVGLILIGLLVVTLVAYALAYGSRGQSAILEAERNMACGRIPLARKELRRVARSGSSLGASAGHHLAILANREGDFGLAMVEVERALALCKAPATFEVTRFFVVPGLLTESAVALAGLDRFEEATRELATLQEGFPEYAHLGVAAFRVRLLCATRRGNAEEASAIAASRTPDLALDFATELLADLALGDRSFEADLASSPMTAAWLRKVTPTAQSAETSTLSNENAPT